MGDAANESRQLTLSQLLVTVMLFAALSAGGIWLARWLAAEPYRGFTLWPIMLVVPGLVIALGFWALSSRSTMTATRAEGFSHGLGFVGLIATIYGIAPPFLNIFGEFDLPLPFVTTVVKRTHSLATEYLEQVVLASITFLLVDAVLFALLHARPSCRYLARIWSGIVTILLVTAIVLSLFAVLSAFFGLMDPISLS